MFTNRQAGNNLQENELKAVQEFLCAYITPFKSDRMRHSVLESLVFSAEVLNIESDDRIFTTKTDENALLEIDERRVKSKKPSKKVADTKAAPVSENSKLLNGPPTSRNNDD